MLDCLTIYNRSAQYIRDVQAISELQYQLPLNTIPESIVILDANRQLVPYRILSYGISDNNGCLPIGEKATVYGESRNFYGKILSCDPGQVTLSNHGITTIVKNPTSIEGYSQSKNIIIFVDRPGTTISYRLNGISWNPIATAIVDELRGIVNFYLFGYIENNTGEQFNVNLMLAVGDINQQTNQAMFERVAVSGGQVQVSNDAIFFNMGQQTLESRNNLQILSFQARIEKIYSATTASNNVTYGYQFVTPCRLPSSQVNSYVENGLKFIGSSNIPETPIGNKIVLQLGTGGQVTANTNISRTETERFVDLNIQSLIQNHSQECIIFELSHYIGDAAVLSARHGTCIWDRKDNGFIIWKIQIPPFTGTTFECSLQIARENIVTI